MLEWTPASSPPKESGLYLIWCVKSDNQTYLSLAYRAMAVRRWIEIFQGGFDRVLDDEMVRWWQPAPKSPEDTCQSKPRKS